MTERKPFTIYDGTGDSASGGVEVEAHEVRIYGADGDCELTIPVPQAGYSSIGAPPPEPMRQSFVLATQGKDNEFDALGVLVEALKPLDQAARIRAVAYLGHRFGLVES